MRKQLRYDYSLMLSQNIGAKGISEKKITSMAKQMQAAHRAVHALLDSGEQGFIKTLSSKKDLALIQKTARKIRTEFKQLLVIGIGGSDLGARALQQLFSKQHQGVEVLFLGDTTDPAELQRVFQLIDWKHCAIHPISKSGNTIEPLAVFLAVRRELIKRVGKNNHAKHIFVLTEDKQSIFADLAKEEGYYHIPHPMKIGGRWTILSLVGLLNAAASGIDIVSLRKGGMAFYRKAKKQKKNAAMLYAILHYLARQQDVSNAVFMPYTSGFDALGMWYRQLFAESLGKKKDQSGKIIYTGVTPIVSIGPKDQHSQVQLYAEGPFDKVITFLRIDEPRKDLLLPAMKEEAIAVLSKASMHSILNTEQEATALALASHKRMNGTILLSEISENTVGELIIFFELACAYLAELMQVNAYDQPGVEEGKRSMYALLGKSGHKALAKKIEHTKKKMKKRIV